MLQSHYGSTLDFSNEALQASEKGFTKLMESIALLDKIVAKEKSTSDIQALEKFCYQAMDDDFNTPILISHLFEAARIINSVAAGTETISEKDLELLKALIKNFVYDVLGLLSEAESSGKNNEALEGVMGFVLSLRQKAKSNKDFETSDEIRNKLL